MIHKFYPIVPDADWLARLVPLGVKTIQLRLKQVSQEHIKRDIEKGLEICAIHKCQLIVNDYWQEAIALGADYIHLGQEDLAGADLSAIRKANLKLGLSTHDHKELERALAAKPDYVALGPIYETKLKKMKWAPQGLDRIAEWKSAVPCPLVAIGGITVERAQSAIERGADSVAVVTDIITRENPEARVHEWLALLGE